MRKKGDGKGSEFIRAYDKEHGIQPASKLVEEGKKNGHEFGLSLVYMVRRRVREEGKMAKALNGKEIKVKVIRSSRFDFGSSKHMSMVRDMVIERTLKSYRKQLVEAVMELGVVESKKLIEQIQGQL